MDTAISQTGDWAVDVNERPYLVDGQEERQQQLYLRLAVKKGSFCYDRTLGSELAALDVSCSDALLQAEAQARQALAALPEAEVTGVSAEEGRWTVFVRWDGQDYTIPVRRERDT